MYDTDENAERTLRETYPGPTGECAAGLYRVHRASGMSILDAAERVLLTVLDVQQGGRGDPAEAYRRNFEPQVTAVKP